MRRRDMLSATLATAATGFAAVGSARRAAADCGGAANDAAVRGHAIAIHGTPKYPAAFTHFATVNPNAPKGGVLYQAAIGTFDSLNPHIIKGTPANVAGYTGIRLMRPADDEAASVYAHLARSIETPGDRSWVVFELDPRARFHDGEPITAEDVVFSLNILREKGRPTYRQYFGNVDKAEAAGRHTVRFRFKPGAINRELPVIIAGDLPILPKHYWEKRDFERASLDIPLGSGPYKIREIVAGRTIVLDRVKDHWAADLPVNRGWNNFNVIRYDYFRDLTIAREAFKGGEFDHWDELVASHWATSFDTADMRSGSMQRREIPSSNSGELVGFIFNTRRPMFKDWRLRRALAYAFDFEWTNRNIFYGAYKRTLSYFERTELAARDLPAGEERKILEAYRGKIPDRVFTERYALPVYDGSGDIRAGLRQAFELLAQTGWEVRDFELVEKKTGQPLRFEILINETSFERPILPYIRNLKRLGIEARLRLVDDSQYVKRVQKFDYDVIYSGWGQSLSPGNEQRDNWTSAAADKEDSSNYAGVKNAVVDELVERLIGAPDRECLIAHARALDRVLLAEHYVVPGWHLPHSRTAFWDKFGLPPGSAFGGIPVTSWWHDPAKAARLKGRIRSLG